VRRVLLGVLALVLATAAAPARADSTYGSVSGINGVLYDDCLSYPYAFSVGSAATSAGYWDLTAELVRPDGHVTATDYVAQPAATGTSTFGLLCPSDGYGTYTVRATLRWGPDQTTLTQSSRLDDAHFTLRKPRSRTTLTASTRRPVSGQVVRYRVTAYDERPSGFVRRAFAWVHLEKRAAGHWVRIKGARAMTHSNGAVRVRLRYLGHHRTLRLRAVTEPTSRFSRSASPTLRLW